MAILEKHLIEARVELKDGFDLAVTKGRERYNIEWNDIEFAKYTVRTSAFYHKVYIFFNTGHASIE